MRKLAVPLVGAFASGMAPGLVAAALAFLPVGDAAKSVFVSSSMCGMIAASISGGFLADSLGRVRAMRLAGWIALLATPFLCVPLSIFAIAFVGRFAQGFGLGLFSVLLPLYIAETQPDDQRGRAIAFYQFSNSLGGIVAAFCGLVVASWGQAPTAAWGLSPSAVWRVDILMIIPILTTFVIGSFFVSKGSVPRNLGTVPKDVGTVPMGGLVLAIVVLALTSATGIGSVMHYSVTMMTEAGLSGVRANAADTVMRVCGLAAALFSAAFIDRRGRGFVLKIGTAGAMCALSAVSAMFFAFEMGTVPKSGAFGATIAVFLCLFVAFFSFGPGVCVWVIAAELLPASVRAKGMSVALLGNQAVTAAIAAVFLPVASCFGYAPLFFVFALAAAAYFAVARLRLYAGDSNFGEL